MVRVLVCGGRDYSDRERMFAVLDKLHGEAGIDVIIHGAYRGADTLADDWARARGVLPLPFPADWENHGSFAGPMRNTRMIQEGEPDICIAFPGHGGTADCTKKARRAGIEVIQIAP